ncbi:DUF3598 family protein [Cyanobacterium aponinum UTEX 3222]|uniref:DUF3598 family protein n=1 Tax=Cyanobacterium aponinum TaxID=379064 RepID=UPI0030871CAC|nr:DUF3598 family protein [Cyanobacterium aponinum UTEX 3222]
MSSSQWSYLLKNSGVWLGSFSQFSPHGKLLKETSSKLTLGSDDGKTIRFTLARDGNPNPVVNEFSSLNRNIFLFEDGHFAKGSQQFSPFSVFGAEYGYVRRDRRCRLVQLFDKDSNFDSVTLIREFREGGEGIEREHLTIEQLEGEWRGEALTLYPVWRNSEPYQTQLTLKREGNTLKQTLKTPFMNYSSEGTINDNIITFNQGNKENRVLLLPDGASSTTPVKIENRQSFFLEFGWLVETNMRLRLIRKYDDQGRWVSITLVQEIKS